MMCFNCNHQLESNKSFISVSSKYLNFKGYIDEINYPFCSSDCFLEKVMEDSFDEADEEFKVTYNHLWPDSGLM